MSDSEDSIGEIICLLALHAEMERRKKDPLTSGWFKSGCDDEDQDVDIVKNPKGNPKDHALCAAENGHTSTVKQLLKNDPSNAGIFVFGCDDADQDVDMVKKPKANPKDHALWAAENGHTSTVKQLKNDPSNAGIFVFGCDDADQDVVMVKKPKANPKDHTLCAAENGHTSTVKQLLTTEPSLLHVQNSDGYTMLHMETT